jgi:hypothetical protein
MESELTGVKSTRDRLTPMIFFAGDLIVLMLFVLIGQRDHSVDDPQPVLPLGALLRSFANGTGVILSPFLVVTLLVGATFLLAWRLGHALLLKRRT